MNDRKKRIDEFLKFFRDVAKQNPNYNLSSNAVYYELSNLGIPISKKGTQIDGYFSYWIDYFKNSPNCDVFVDDRHKYFCQFVSKDNNDDNSKEYIKIYVPLNSSHIGQGAIEIFDYLSKENISHVSKIGSHIRTDDVVIRLKNPNDAKKLLVFLDNNEYIKEGLMISNPFLFNINNIPMAVDGRLSYNFTIANIVTCYINIMKQNNCLDNVSVDDFYSFISFYYQNAFFNNDGLQMLKNDFDHNEEIDDTTIVNYKNIFELILKSVKDNFSFEDYINHYLECSNDIMQNEKTQKIYEIRSGIDILTNNEKITKDIVDSMLLMIIKVMTEKYHNEKIVIAGIERYIMCGDIQCITRYKGLRNMVYNSSFRDDLLKIIKYSNTTFIDYVQNLLKSIRNNSYDDQYFSEEAESFKIK